MVLTRKQYGKLMDNYPRLALKLLTNLARMMSQRLRRTSGILVEFLED
jgi:CRP-like cAMP-binding protein